MRHGIVVDGGPFAPLGRLAWAACARRWPNTVARLPPSRSEYPGSRFYPLTTTQDDSRKTEWDNLRQDSADEPFNRETSVWIIEVIYDTMNQILLGFLLIVGLLILSALLYFTADEIEYTKTYKPPGENELIVPASEPTLSIAEFKQLVSPTYLQRVQAMESQDNSIRRNALKAVLEHAGIGYKIHDSGRNGKHIVLDELGKGDDLFLIFAHYDTVGGVKAESSATYGANDNLSCVSAAIGSYLQLNAKNPENVRVRFVFPDLEEMGRTPVGSKAYASEADFEGYIGALSMELCGIGNPDGSAGTATFWDRTEKFRKTELFKLAVEAMERAGIPHRNEVNNEHSSDHNNFQKEPFSKLGGSFGFVMMADEQRDRMNYFDNLYHTKGDVSQILHEPIMARAAKAILQVVYTVDKARSTIVDQ